MRLKSIRNRLSAQYPYPRDAVTKMDETTIKWKLLPTNISDNGMFLLQLCKDQHTDPKLYSHKFNEEIICEGSGESFLCCRRPCSPMVVTSEAVYSIG